MITEYFLNNCFTLIFSKSDKIKVAKPLFRDIIEIIGFYREKQSLDIPVTAQNKVDCLVKICELKLKDMRDDIIIDSLCSSDKYLALSDFLRLKLVPETNDQILSENVKQIRTRKRLVSMFSNFDKLNSFVDTVKNASFDSMNDAVLDYENVIKQLYSNMMEESRSTSIEASSSLDMMKDDYTPIIDMIRKTYERKNTTPTGFTVLDNEILTCGGFEPSRLYIFGGGSGSGKSTLLDNFVVNAATNTSLNRDLSKKRVYIYITMENRLHEALLRRYQSIVEKQLTEVLTDIFVKGINIESYLQGLLTANNSNIINKYFPSNTISSVDIMMVVDDVISEYKDSIIMGLYIDYLDLLTSESQYEQYRLELGSITSSLKNIAIYYNIPVITLTQLNRAVYGVQNSGSLSLSQMSESIKKVEHADFTALMIHDEQEPDIVHFKVGKNRNGKTNMTLDFKVDFSFFKFLVGNKVSNRNNPDITTEKSLLKFEGLKIL